ncbi:MAG TPA: META domain-containing protein [Ktedonobacteraceae bacterium]|nr:META domain-containing protein [Ktedonobacteraceae bacterium]
MFPAIKARFHFLFVLCLIPGTLVACTSNSSSGGSLTGVTWQLTEVKFDGQSTSNVISEPTNYTITFQTDGTANVKADCNMASLTYTTSGKQLTIKAGPMTLAYCGSESLSNEFVQALQLATSYTLQNSTLTINSGANGTMNFKQSQA